MKGIFKATTYTTNNISRHIADRLMLGSRWFFIGKFLSYVFECRPLAVKGIYNNKEWVHSSYSIFKLIEKCGGKFHLTGLENIEHNEGPTVFISNHMSILETMVLPCLIAPVRDVTFVVKDSLVKHAVFGPIMRSRNPVVVSRDNSREDFKTVLTKGQELLAQGTSIVIFPQSTRKVEFTPKEFNTLGVKLAKAAKVPVVPVAIKTDFWQNGKYLKDLGPIDRKKPIHMHFGKPFRIEGSGKEENNMIIDFISSHLDKWNK